MKPPIALGQTKTRPHAPNAAPILRAAEYVRMSTEGQQYSIPRQQAAIREYASAHRLTVVRSYVDAGRSGLTLKGRLGLIQLLDDVQQGKSDFDAILVYDVSRWGRFQDIDESAYYEYLCRKAGIRVEYCVELFENDGGPLSAILKNLKRVVAAEFSRERSNYVHRSICMTAARGHFPGGAPTYGMRRVLHASGEKSRVLDVGERRAVRSDRVVMAPGPTDEVRTVRRIFRLFVEQRLTPQAIASHLNREAKVNRLGNQWKSGNIRHILSNEIYVGTQVYNRCSRNRLSDAVYTKNDPSDWVRKPDAFAAIVSRSQFDAAQQVIRERKHTMHTEASLLERLRYLLRTHGFLSVELIRAHPEPDVVVFQRRFGGVLKAYEKIGYVQSRDKRDMSLSRRMRPKADSLLGDLTEILHERGARVTQNRFYQCMVIDNSVRFSVRAVPWWPTPIRRRPGWRIRLDGTTQSSFRVLAFMDEMSERPLHFLLLPPGRFLPAYSRLNEPHLKELRRFRCLSLGEVAARLLSALD